MLTIHFYKFSVPDPPSNLSVSVRSGKTAIISWSPPVQGSFSSFKLKINPLSNTLDPKPPSLTIEDVQSSSYILRDLTPGATYQVQAFTVFEGKESAAYTSRNFTTSTLFNFVIATLLQWILFTFRT